jgi:hypothetical protein
MKKKSAFSLIELSIIILIVAILIAGVIKGSRLLISSKISNAQTLTQSSPVASIKNLYAWYETSSEGSFDSEVVDNDDSITVWRDRNPQKTTGLDLTQGTGSAKPSYKLKSLNDIPTVYFDGGDFLASTLDFGMNGNPDFTFFVVGKIEGGNYGPFVSAGTNSTCKWVAFARDTGSENGEVFTGFHSGGQHYTHATLGTSSIFAIHTWVRTANNVNNNKTGNTAFVNGQTQVLVNEGSTCVPSLGTSTLKVGFDTSTHYFTGNVAEIIIFDRALKTEERKAVEYYLGKKWNIELSVDEIIS